MFPSSPGIVSSTSPSRRPRADSGTRHCVSAGTLHFYPRPAAPQEIANMNNRIEPPGWMTPQERHNLQQQQYRFLLRHHHNQRTAENSSNTAAATPILTATKHKKKKCVWFFRITLVLLDILVYLALSDTAHAAAGPRPAQLPRAPVIVQSKQVFLPKLQKARSLQATPPEFTPMERFVLNEQIEVLTTARGANTSPSRVPKYWWAYVLVGGLAMEQLYATYERRQQQQQTQNQDPQQPQRLRQILPVYDLERTL